MTRTELLSTLVVAMLTFMLAAGVSAQFGARPLAFTFVAMALAVIALLVLFPFYKRALTDAEVDAALTTALERIAARNRYEVQDVNTDLATHHTLRRAFARAVLEAVT